MWFCAWRNQFWFDELEALEFCEILLIWSVPNRNIRSKLFVVGKLGGNYRGDIRRGVYPIVSNNKIENGKNTDNIRQELGRR